ncbi:antitoxin [Humidisolicoccus flavus]|uniref:antitoxin n=1 Tax=Humidisolicoccus flavus TaxID=3111414 RepID=UPI00324572B6
MAKEDITGKVKQFLSDPKVTEALKSEKAENVSDNILDGVANAAKKVSGGKFDQQIDSARDSADKHIGNE